MNPKLAIFFVFFLNLFLFAKSQNDTIRLIPEIGKQYIYEFTESTYILTVENEKQDRFIKKKTFEIKFDKFQPENKEILQVKIIRNIIGKPDEKPTGLRDYRFPYLQEGFPDNSSPEFTETLLSRLTFKYSFDFETDKIELTNLVDILLEARNILKEKGFSQGKIDNRITDFNEKVIPETTLQIQQIFQISGGLFSKENFNPEVFDMSVKVQKPWTQIDQKRWKKEPGLYSANIVYDAEKRFLKEYNTVEIDSLKYPVWFQNNKYNFKYIENNIHLRDARDIPQNRFVISGKIENLKNKKVTLAILHNPFGTDLSEETVFLDENNTFQIETELKHPQLVYLQFGNKNFVDNLPMMAFYAEPGGRIHFEAKGDTFPWDVSFSGDFAGASKFLYDLQKEYNIFNQRLDWNTINYLRGVLSYSDFMRAFYEFKDFSSKYKNEMEEYVFNFVTRETEAFLFSLTIEFLRQSELSINTSVNRYSFPGKEELDIPFLYRKLDSLNISDIYNEYGIHSRLMATNYLDYFFGKNRKVIDSQILEFTSSILISNYRYYNDLPHQVEVAKNILAGHPLYSVLADLFVREKMNISNQPSWFEEYTQNQIDTYFDLMIRVCNDNEFINAMRKVVDNHKNWEDKNYVPPTKFFNEKGGPVYMSDFFGEKPTVFYITNDWSVERYFWDDLAKENPKINFVLVMEGSNIQEWMDYEKRAEPVASQLFLINNEIKLKNIFKSNTKHFIVYDKNGTRIAFSDNAVSARDFATQSLMYPSKKQLNKSQLKIIILILSVTLLAFILGIIIWRWQVRQKFRKEEQQRRLRELELTAIRSQMNPHFLFNSLNSVQNLVQQNKGREAHLYLADFAGLIRKVLQNSEKEEVSLAEELEMVRQYLNLEKLRFDFDFSVSVPDKVDTNNTMVPSLLLQPFAENAVIHGLQHKQGNRRLKVEVSRENSEIKITIEDNGIGRTAAKEFATEKNRKSSKLIKERLEILQQKQGENYHLEIIDIAGEETGTRVEIIIPEEK